MQRRGAEIGLREREFHQRPAERNDTGRNPRTNGLFLGGPENCGLAGPGGGAGSQLRTSLAVIWPISG
jgi:hypothetical protein